MIVPAVVLAAPGTNRHNDVSDALRQAGADPVVVQLAELRAEPGRIAGARIVVVAGGFSFADATGSGRLFALELRDILRGALEEHVAAGGLVLGICNGFQVLVRLGLLPGADAAATLAHNAKGRFECRWVSLVAPAETVCVWSRGLPEPIECPVAHGEGRFVAPPDVLAAMERNGQVALRYGGAGYPANPNGSMNDIAGVCDATGRVLGLMPHPENHIHPWQHPRSSRGEGRGLGRTLFIAGVNHTKEF